MSMSKKKLDFLVGGFQALTNLLVLAWTYWIVFLVRRALGHPYAAANERAVVAVFPYLAVLYVILWVAYRLPAFYETPAYEGVLSQVLVQFALALVTLAASFAVRAFAFPRGLVVSSFVLQVLVLILLNYAWYRFYGRVRPKALTICVGADEASAAALAGDLAEATQYVISARTAADVTEEWIQTIPSGASLTVDAGVPVAERDQIIRSAMAHGVTVQLVATVKEALLQNAREKVRADHLLLTVEPDSHSPVDLLLKRLTDIVVAIVALVVFSPVILVASLSIALEDGRPIYYRQERLGLHRRVFRIIKFRTMCHDAERLTGPCLSKGQLDPRITRTGRWLRRTGIDEVPQFINVLLGDMSVVGPRPERPELSKQILETTPDWNLRLLVRPGITGFAQVRGRYVTAPKNKLTMDLAYIRAPSLFLRDLTIILHTMKMFFLPDRRG